MNQAYILFLFFSFTILINSCGQPGAKKESRTMTSEDGFWPGSENITSAINILGALLVRALRWLLRA
ncbi:MAG TPA: hypothetical protein VK152_03130, partial [Paludibacter sp.]|nr:hypothetical protein [Paludibacter sp.]